VNYPADEESSWIDEGTSPSVETSVSNSLLNLLELPKLKINGKIIQNLNIT
jgi:hypothetical protein